jgi:hypothetical protein
MQPPDAERRRHPQKEEGRDPLTWDDDELVRVRDLHARTFTDKAEYLSSRHLAGYLGLGPIEQMHLLLPLHIVFLGFQVRGGRPRALQLPLLISEAVSECWQLHALRNRCLAARLSSPCARTNMRAPAHPARATATRASTWTR